MWYKYTYNSLKRVESRTGRGCNSHRLHQKEILMVHKKFMLGDSDEEPSSKKNIGGNV